MSDPKRDEKEEDQTPVSESAVPDDTDSNSDEEDTENVAESATPTEPTREPERETRAVTTPVRRGGSFTALTALLAAAALALSAWTWLQLGKTPDAEQLVQAGTSETRAQFETSLAEVRETVEKLERAQTRALRDAEGVRSDVEAASEELAAQVRNNSLTLSQLTGISQEARQTWILAEIEYLLIVGNERLTLARDFETALAALRAADRRIRELNDPGLAVVRAQLADEIRALRGIDVPDIQGVALRLGSLTSAARRLPLRATLVEQSTPGSAADDVEEPAGLDRAVNVMGEALSGMISIQRTEENAVLILSENEKELIYQNLELKLQSARLAVLMGDTVNFRESLRTARHWLGSYFDQNDAGVQGALATLAEQESLDIDPEPPDISMSLRLLRQRKSTGDESS